VIFLPEEKEKEIDIFQCELVPKHVLISEKEKSALLHELNINLKQLPRITLKDPAIAKFSAKKGDVIKIIRDSPTAGECIYYRVVV
jgi:DNA-directed RNA polymerase subunit H (RpoH/RPB5)